MNRLSRALVAFFQPQAQSPIDDFWYQPIGHAIASMAGPYITPETALNISTVWACCKAIADDVAGLPLQVFERQEPRGKRIAREHPMYELLHTAPNSYQSSFQFRRLMTLHMLLTGNGYALMEDRMGFADALWPLDPRRMKKVEQMSTGDLRYTYQGEDGREIVYPQDRIFHLRGLSMDGMTGMSVVAQARNSMGLAQAAESFGSQLFSNGVRASGVLQHPGSLGPQALENLRQSFQEQKAGLQNAHKPMILEEGMSWQQISMSAEDAQFLETRGFQVEEIARWFGVPLMRIGHTEKATSWGTGIEQFELGYVKHTLQPVLVEWEQAILRDLILDRGRFFAEFNLDGLLRGDVESRNRAYQISVTNGWMSRNEVREKENLNPVEGLDTFLAPQNMAIVDENGDIQPINQASEPDFGPSEGDNDPSDDDEPEQMDARFATRARQLAYEAAARVVRREEAKIGQIARRTEGDSEAWKAQIAEFWQEHAAHVGSVLHLETDVAKAYVIEREKALEFHGAEDLHRGHDQAVTYLACLALGE